MAGRRDQQKLVNANAGDAAADAQRPIEERGSIASGKREAALHDAVDDRACRGGTKPCQRSWQGRPAEGAEAGGENRDAEGGHETKLEWPRAARHLEQEGRKVSRE